MFMVKHTSRITYGPDDAHFAIRTKGSSPLQQSLNEDIPYKGRVIHVQTEDLGVKKAQIHTKVYEGGRILFSKVSSYEELKVAGKPPQEVRQKVLWHQAAITKGILSGKLDHIFDKQQAAKKREEA